MDKRILCIVSVLDAGGAETFLMKIFRCIASKGYKLDFIVSLRGGVYEQEVSDLGGKIYFVETRTKHPIKAYLQIKNIVQQNKYRNVLKLGTDPNAVFDIIAARAGGAECVAVRACNAVTGIKWYKRAVNRGLRVMLNLFSTRRIAPSKLAAEYMFGRNRKVLDQVVYLNNGLDIDTYSYSSELRNQIRDQYDLRDRFVMGHIGRFNEQKNHAFLLSVFAKVVEKEPDARLLLVGEGKLEDEIKSKVHELKIEDKVVFAGVQSNVRAYLSAMDLFVFPSLFEGMPNTVIEAQANGLSCIVSDTITKEANITGHVFYLGLEDTFDFWVDNVLQHRNAIRFDAHNILLEQGYDILSVSRRFIDLFEEHGDKDD